MPKLRRISRKYVARQHKVTKRRVKHLKNHPFIVPVITFLGLFFIGIVGLVALGGQTIGASDSHVVSVYVDGQERIVPTRAKSVEDLLKRLKIDVEPEDIIEPKKTTPILEDNFTVNVYKARPVTVIDNGKKKTIVTAHQQPRLVVEKAGIKLYPEDAVKTEGPVDLQDNSVISEQVFVDRAVPAYLNLYGTGVEIRTRAKTVGELLQQKNVKLGSGDTVRPALQTPLTPGTQIFVVREGKEVKTEEVAIEPPVETVEDPSLTFGVEKVREAGVPGKKLVTYELDLQNGKEVGRRVIQEVVASNPIKKVIVKGTKPLVTGGKAEWLVAAGVSPSEYGAADYIISRESGWCPTKWQGEYGGCPAYHGAPTSSIGYGLCQATPGYKMATAGEDWAVNPVTQLKWCTNYARSKYGSWQAAYSFWSVNHWW